MTALAARERGSGVPIVLVHGVGASAWSSFTALSAALGERHRVIAIDLPGSGESAELETPPGGWNLDAVADALGETLDRFAVENAVVLGHSLGAAIVARCASRHPERMASIVLVAAALDVEESTSVRIRLWRELFDTDRALLARYLLLTMTTPERLAQLSARELDDLVDIAVSVIPHGTPLQLALAEQSTLRRDLEQIALPVSVLLGCDDPLVAIEPWRQLAVTGAITRLELWSGAHDVLQHRRDEACALLTELAHSSRGGTGPTAASARSTSPEHLLTSL